MNEIKVIQSVSTNSDRSDRGGGVKVTKILKVNVIHDDSGEYRADTCNGVDRPRVTGRQV